MPRTHGWAPVGKRCFGRHDWNAEGRINVIGALLNNEFLAVTPVDGSIDADVFHAWLRHELPPELPDNSVVVMDNAAFHKRDDIQEAVTSCGHELEFLPPYSPDLNPIEHAMGAGKSSQEKISMLG
jgi:transposase